MSRFKQLVVYFVVLVISAGLLVGIAQVENRLDEDIKAHHLRFEGDVNSAPPLVAFTTMALGSFRGLLADILWLRVNALKDEGNYIETVQLANWITDLQPTFSGMTVYLAWDMAYNISVTCSRREDRWRWVQEGIRLIRDKAIYYNPENPELYQNLAWIFFHKMGNIMDDANQYYKNQWGHSMDRVIGSRPDWSQYVGKPYDERSFLRRWNDRDPLWNVLKREGFNDFRTLLNAYVEAGGLPEKLRSALAADLAAELDQTLRNCWLYQVSRMDPAVIVQINDKYGILDWRTMEAQAIYWAYFGLLKTPGGKDIQCERIISQAMAWSFINGQFLYINDDNWLGVINMPNLALAQSVLDTYDQAFEDNESRSFISAKLNFYKDAIVLLYSYGDEAMARKFYEKFKVEQEAYTKEYEPDRVFNWPPFGEFARQEWEEDIRTASYLKITSILVSRVVEMYRAIGEGRLEDAVRLQEQFNYIYDDYQANSSDSEKLAERRGLAPVNEFLRVGYIILAESLDAERKAQLDAWIQVMVRQEEERRKEQEIRDSADL